LSGEDRATATGNTQTEKFVKFARVMFEICEQTERWTERQTDTLNALFRTAPGAKVVTMLPADN